ncbi:MAG: efflux RND transporter periplasmic adaptor subunit [Caulobacterales bacterium]
MKPDIFSSAQSLFKRVNDKFFSDDGVTGEELQARKRRRVVILIGGGIAIAALGIFLLTHFGGGDDVGEPVDRTQAVTAVTVEEKPFERRITLQGEARPLRDYQVFAPASGVRILELLADEGDYVRANQPLARLDTAVSNAQVSAARANVASAEASARRARDEYQRAESIRDSGALSAEAIEQRRAQAAAADAQLTASRAQLAETNARLQGGYVRAPGAGLIISRTAEIGRSVDGQLLFRIAGDNALEVAADVAEADVLALRDGQTATFQLLDGSTINARMRRGAASIDTRTRTGQALFDLPRGSSVRAGMYLRGEAILAPQDGLAAPQSSVLYKDGAAYVFVIGDNNRVRRTNVILGIRSGDTVEIASGLAPGQKIVGAGAAFLQDGDLVRPITNQPAGESAPDAQQTGDESGLRGRSG